MRLLLVAPDFWFAIEYRVDDEDTDEEKDIEKEALPESATQHTNSISP